MSLWIPIEILGREARKVVNEVVSLCVPSLESGTPASMALGVASASSVLSLCSHVF